MYLAKQLRRHFLHTFQLWGKLFVHASGGRSTQILYLGKSNNTTI